MNTHENKTQHRDLSNSKHTQEALHTLIRRLNLQLQEEEVLLLGLEDVNQLEDVGVLNPE